jgi:large subunit ribosomal protein L31
MRQDLHPTYTGVSAKLSCGIVLTINSVLKEGMSIDVRSRCHPVYTDTGKQKTIDAGGRVERFRKRFGSTAKTMEVGGS